MAWKRENPVDTEGFSVSDLNPPKAIHAPESSLDFIIRVDRLVKPSYPDWVTRLMHPKLEFLGPAEYDLRTEVRQWFCGAQVADNVSGWVVYHHLKKNNILADCLGLDDLLAIQAKDVAVFRTLYAGKAVFGWKSIAQTQSSDRLLSVPHLHDAGDAVNLSWHHFNVGWQSCDATLYFFKKNGNVKYSAKYFLE